MTGINVNMDPKLCTLMSHLLTGMKFSDFTTFVFSVPGFRDSSRSCHISFDSVKY